MMHPTAQYHFKQPQHVGRFAAHKPDAGTPDAGTPDAGTPDAGTPDAGTPDVRMIQLGQPLRGGVLCLQVQVQDQSIIAVRQQVYGCPYLIATGSWLADWLEQKTVSEAQSFTKHLIEDALELPPNKIHCAVLAEQAVKQLFGD